MKYRIMLCFLEELVNVIVYKRKEILLAAFKRR